MKRFYIVLNIFLVVAIVLSLSIQPKHKNISTKHIPKSITTSEFRQLTFRKTEEKEEEKETDEVEEAENDEEKEPEENKITESVTKVEDNFSNNLVQPTVVTDVLETQTGTMSAYGPDCRGCSGHLATGFDARQSITYQDGTYGTVRIVAGDRKYPFGTIVRIKGAGSDFNAIVLDRGGDIGIGRRFMFDLLCTSEAEASRYGTHYNLTFEILRYGY